MEIETRLDVPEQAIEEALAEIISRPTVFAIEDLASGTASRSRSRA